MDSNQRDDDLDDDNNIVRYCIYTTGLMILCMILSMIFVFLLHYLHF
jgi:hypothetical protein